MMMRSRKKDRRGVVWSTDPSFEYEPESDEQETLPPGGQTLYVSHDRKQRKGKVVTLVEGFVGTSDDLQTLGKLLKSRCGTGGSAKDGEILVQGEWREKVAGLLEDEGYTVRIKGGQ